MLTPKQWRDRSTKLLNVIELSLDATGEIPTLSQMSAHLGMAKSTVHELLMRMQREGLIDWDKHMTKTLCVTWDGDRLYEEAREHGKQLIGAGANGDGQEVRAK